MNTSEISVERGSGNVFADLDLPDADSHLLKAELVSRIDDILQQRRTTQAEAARALGLSRPDLSRLLRGGFREYSLERLFHFLTALGCDIDIVIRPSDPDTKGKLRIVAPEIG
ncbi:MAG: helix-turn-helix transcriptional regulator [Defluviicoccus sp.]|nr:helix-turn-helix transcriptional regulator [Defluviicoccus sp.]MDE2914566.1 helix-turn-helix transcriptional regulator [Paracoccaceae bacterium]